jgi:chromosomal replication initiation ATPase DnaA
MAPQLILDLPVRTARGRGDFFVSPANALALAALDATASWPQGKMLLTGPAGSGKTHLAHVWAAETGAALHPAGNLPNHPQGPLVIEDIDRIAGDIPGETALFHLHNNALSVGVPFLMTSRMAPAALPFALPDLASRLHATAIAALLPPDDALLSAVLVKLFADRQIAVPANLIGWLLPRMHRSLSEAGRLVGLMDARALATGRPVTRALAAAVLDIGATDGP